MWRLYKVSEEVADCEDHARAIVWEALSPGTLTNTPENGK